MFAYCIAVPQTSLTVSVSQEGGTSDGDTYTLACVASKDPGLVSPVEVGWVGPDGSSLSGSEAGIAQTVTTMGSTTMVVLQFDPLSTPHGGRYTCQAAVQTIALAEPLMVTRSENLRVQSKCYCRIIHTISMYVRSVQFTSQMGLKRDN